MTLACLRTIMAPIWILQGLALTLTFMTTPFSKQRESLLLDKVRRDLLWRIFSDRKQWISAQEVTNQILDLRGSDLKALFRILNLQRGKHSEHRVKWMRGMPTSMTVRTLERKVLVHMMSSMDQGRNTSIRKTFSSARRGDSTWLKIIPRGQELI